MQLGLVMKASVKLNMVWPLSHKDAKNKQRMIKKLRVLVSLWQPLIYDLYSTSVNLMSGRRKLIELGIDWKINHDFILTSK